eukprot:823133-Amphidinium_carterae.1
MTAAGDYVQDAVARLKLTLSAAKFLAADARRLVGAVLELEPEERVHGQLAAVAFRGLKEVALPGLFVTGASSAVSHPLPNEVVSAMVSNNQAW